MEIFENEKDTKEETYINKRNKIDELSENIESIKITEKKDNECIINIYQINKIEPKDKNILKSICKIKIETNSETLLGIGYLLKFMIEQETLYCLITNEKVIKNEIINNNNKISLYFNNELKIKDLKADSNKRYIKTFIDIGLDITLIEILDNDNIPKDLFLYNEDEFDKNSFINRKIRVSQYLEGNEFVNNKGKIIKINQYEFIYSTDMVYDSSGSLILLENSDYILGIHKGNNEDKTENYGYLLYSLISIIKNDINQRKNNGKYINGKYIWEDGKYYIGEYKDNLPNGKGIKYYPNGNILYEGVFINGKFDGKGKYYYDDGDYFIGEYKNGLRNGKGIVYYKNGNLLFEGEYVNDEREGNGKYIWEDGEYYIGQFKNGVANGKGIIYYSNGNIRYEGDWIIGKKEGYGKLILKNGEYYIGQFKNDLANGKGILYYSNGNIKYDGDFIDDQFEGNGKFIWEDGKYYIGRWKNSSRHGKGTLYYSNGNIMYEGDFINNKYEGYGKYIWEDGTYYIGQEKNSLRHGKGTEYYANSKIRFKGFYNNDERDGIGHYIYNNGEYYIGQFRNNFKHGKGTLYDSNGKIKHEGNWMHDIFVGI